MEVQWYNRQYWMIGSGCRTIERCTDRNPSVGDWIEDYQEGVGRSVYKSIFVVETNREDLKVDIDSDGLMAVARNADYLHEYLLRNEKINPEILYIEFNIHDTWEWWDYDTGCIDLSKPCVRMRAINFGKKLQDVVNFSSIKLVEV